jgi:predicted nucleotidyltransferase component of viral defense system
MRKLLKRTNPDLSYLEKIKKLALLAFFSDDELMERLVFKGGNALDMGYGISVRSSIDIDLSMRDEFVAGDLESVKKKVIKTLSETFDSEGYIVFDIKFAEEPEVISPELRDFWGGYEIEFKVIEKSRYAQLESTKGSLRRNALVVGPDQRRKFTVQISKFEYCEKKQEKNLEGYKIYLYSPEMMVFEKLRAICQQMPEYRELVKSGHSTARSRDFVDIYCLVERFEIRVDAKENLEILRYVFNAKKVPLELIGKISLFREFHKEDFSAVKDTAKAGKELKDYDFYFDYVLGLCEALKPLWEK